MNAKLAGVLLFVAGALAALISVQAYHSVCLRSIGTDAAVISSRELLRCAGTPSVVLAGNITRGSLGSCASMHAKCKVAVWYDAPLTLAEWVFGFDEWDRLVVRREYSMP